MSVSDLDKEYPGFFTRLSKGQESRLSYWGFEGRKSCIICNNYRDGIRCDRRYHEVESGNLKDCWTPIGTVLVWDHEGVI
jgi:hypothetical protein